MGKQGGSTLVEVVISLLLTCVMVSAVFSVALTSKQGGGKADRKVLGGEIVASLQDSLKAYATDSSSNFASTYGSVRGPNYRARCAAGNTCTNAPGGYCCQQGWNIHTPGVQEDHACNFATGFGNQASIGGQQDGYALTAGNHCLVCVAPATAGADTACYLPKILRDTPYNGQIYYQVSYPGGAGTPPNVQVGIWWNEP